MSWSEISPWVMEVFQLLVTVLAAVATVVWFFAKRFFKSLDERDKDFGKIQENNDKAFQQLQREISIIAQRVAWLEGTHDRKPSS